MESEKNTEAHLFNRMRSIGGSSSKWVCPNYRGKPDRICEFPYGLVAFVEVKSEGEEPEPHQLREHDRMRKRGQLVLVLDTKRAVDNFITFFKGVDNELRLCDRIKQYTKCVGQWQETYTRSVQW